MGCVLTAAPVWAAPVKGCNQTVLTAMEAKAQARVAYDVASTEQVLDKPDSVLFMTCFNNSAGNAAANIGTIFSDDYTVGIDRIVPDSLTAFNNDWAESLGNDSGVVDYTQTAVGTTITACDEMPELWQENSDEGIQKNIPYVTYEELKLNAVPTGALTTGTFDDDPAGATNQNFVEDWQQAATDGTFSDLQTATAAGTLPTVTIPSYAATTDACSVVTTAGIAGTCP
ncbi:MAG: hypothetical protein ACAH80_12280 [Alphaproteobacteria bacterium]